MTNRTKTYFLSDAHLGAPYIKDSKAHEKRLIRFLDKIKDDAKTIYLLGDIFDYWYEYKHVIPKGFVRFQAKLAELVDNGIEIHYFGGNHDMWIFGYFEEELGIILHHKPKTITIDGKTFFLAHGEDIGIEDWKFKFLLKVFRSPIVRWAFSNLIHPDLSMSLAKKWSGNSRKKNADNETAKYMGEDKEFMVKFAKAYDKEHIDYFIFGHRHILLDLMIKKNSRVIILGDWISHFSYAIVEDGNLSLRDDEQ